MISRSNMEKLIIRFRDSWLQRYPDDIDVMSKGDRDKRLGIDSSKDLASLLRHVKRARPIEDVCRLAKTPRLLKLILRQTYRIWERLHGEIDFDDMLVANTIRYGAPEAFEFLLEHYEEIRGLQDDGVHRDRKTRLEIVEGRWGRTAEAVKWDTTSAKSLAQFLFPCWCGQSHVHNAVLQGVHVSDPTDYWSRYLTEELDSCTIRDQEILHGFAAWRKDAHGAHFRSATLPLVLCLDSEFSSKIEYFLSARLTGRDIRQIATETFEQALVLQGVKASSDSILGFIPLWRLAIRHPIDEPEHLEWVKNEIFKALSKSLRFANDVYYYWSSNNEADIHGKPDRVELRNQVVTYAQNIFADKPHDFIRVIDPHYLYSSYHFRVYFTVSAEGESVFTTHSGDWFSGLLLEAGEINPQVIVPQIACLVIDEQHSFEGFNYSFKVGLSEELFGAEMLRLMHILSTEINVDSFSFREKKLIQAAREVATEWLKENSS